MKRQNKEKLMRDRINECKIKRNEKWKVEKRWSGGMARVVHFFYVLVRRLRRHAASAE